MIHIYKTANQTGYEGLAIVQDARRSINLADAAEDSALDFYSSGLNVNALIHATAPMTPNQAKQAV